MFQLFFWVLPLSLLSLCQLLLISLKDWHAISLLSKFRQTGLQTDATNALWSAVLCEENGGKQGISICKSGQFKPKELHYYFTFQEILAVKSGIENFQF